MNPKVDFFFNKESQWKKEYAQLRRLMLSCGLTEALKWGVPCYTLNNSNVVLIHGFKDYCALLFHKGALLKDTENLLIQQTKNVQSARQIRFTDLSQIVAMESTLKAYVYEAMEVEKAGLEVKLKKTQEFEMPEEFRVTLEENPDLKAAFERLTPGRQRGYLLYFSQAKQAKTRESRIEKYWDHIINGKGLKDEY
ncbi:MAG: YdeI family protein [Marinoscillum sp.]